MLSTWVIEAIKKIEKDFKRSADTHLFPLTINEERDVQLYIKDESTHPTGSLKHRLARSLFLYALCNGHIKEGTTVVEASSGSTAVSEAYFAKMLNLPFVAVMAKSTAKAKIDLIEFYGGKCAFVDKPNEVYIEAQRIANETNGHYMDQFTYAERATDWRGNNNIAESIFEQMENETNPLPSWVIVGAGTGGTSATIGRYIRYKQLTSQLCVADPENSVFYPYFKEGDDQITSEKGSRIEGIGRQRVEPSFIRGVVDRMIQVPDAASMAAIHFLYNEFGLSFGPSTGTNMYAGLELAKELQSRNEKGSIVLLAGDSGNRYLDTCFDSQWLKDNGFDIAPYLKEIEADYAQIG